MQITKTTYLLTVDGQIWSQFNDMNNGFEYDVMMSNNQNINDCGP